MREILVICVFVATHLHADNANNATQGSTSTTVAPVDSFDMDEELAKIAAACVTDQEQVHMSGNLIGIFFTRSFNWKLVSDAADIIASTEMRATLGFAPPAPWTHYKEPSEKELASAVTAEEYFELRDRNEDRSLDSEYFLEKNFPPVIAFLDKRFPAIRTIYKRKFREILSVDLEGRIDRKTVDYIIEKYNNEIYDKVDKALSRMLRKKKECTLKFRNEKKLII